VLLAVCAGLAACAQLLPYRTPTGISHWKDPTPPRLSLAGKARSYQERLEARHQMSDGVIRYQAWSHWDASEYGSLADGSFFQGLYLASQALRWAATGDSAAREQVLLTLRAMELYAEVSGRRGLIARYVSRRLPSRGSWRRSTTHPGYFWRTDVSKDQYAGYAHGLGVALAVLPDPEIRARLAPLAAAIADHLIENELEIVDWDGGRTTHGSLRKRMYGIPAGANALIALNVAKTAAVATGDPRHRDFHARLVNQGYIGAAAWAHHPWWGNRKRVNENMAYLSLYPLLLLETDEAVAGPLREAGRRAWRHLGDEHNAFFAFVQAAVVGDGTATVAAARDPAEDPIEAGRASLGEFPDEKVAFPVDLTRPGFDYPRAFLETGKGEPRSTRAVPLYLRPSGSNLWVSDPYRLVGGLHYHGDPEYAGVDYLLAYWIARYHGFVGPQD
jgi:hypothetical protein